MAHLEFNLDGPAFERCTRQVIQPNHITRVREEEEVLEADVDAQFFQIPPVFPAPPEEQEDQAGDAQENSSVLKCIMEDSRDPLHAFQEGELYRFGVDSGSDSDVPEDELSDEMEDTSSGEDQLILLSLQGEEGPPEGNIPRDDTIAIEENIELSVANLPITLVNWRHLVRVSSRHLDGMEDITAIEENQLVLVHSQEAEHTTEDDHDQSSPVIIPAEDICSEDDELTPVNLQEQEDPTFQGDRDRMSHSGSIPLEELTAVEEDQLIPVNLQEEEDPTGEGDHDQSSLIHESANGDSIDLKDVNETALKQAMEVGAPETGEPRRDSPEAFDQVQIH